MKGIISGIAVAVLVCLGAQAAYAAPAYTVSRYMATVNRTTLYNEGCSMGSASQSGIVLLDFGQPWNSGGTQGSIIFDANLDFVSIAQITNAAEGYLDGFWNCSPSSPQLRLAIGTSNYKSTTGYVTYAHGQAWGNMVNTLANYISSKGYGSQEYARGADDIEMDWDNTTQSRAWVDGFNAASTAPLYDYGDAAGCPPYGSCNNGWSQNDLWYVSWGSRDSYPVPEIYTNGTANEWYQESLYSSLNKSNGRLGILGTLTQWAASGNCCTFTPAQGFDTLQNLLNSDSRTSYNMSYSTDITYAN